MITQLRLQNFKNWKHLTLDLSNVNVLFGANSSGKSAILQALLLLKQTYPSDVSLNFGGKPNDYVDLGDYTEVTYQHDTNLPLGIGLTMPVDTGRAISILQNNYHLDTEKLIPAQVIDLNFRWRLDNNLIQLVDRGQFSLDFEGTPKRLFFSNEWMIAYRQNIHYLGPIRQIPSERLYKLPNTLPDSVGINGEYTMDALVQLYADANSGLVRERHPLDEIVTWLVAMGLVESFELRPIDQENRYFDARIRTPNAASDASVKDVGFGVTQVLPVVTMLYTVPLGSIVLLEQPEIHLHPSAEFVLADLCLHVAKERNLQLIIESHSENSLRRIQRRVAEIGNPNTQDGAIAAYANALNHIKLYFVQNSDEGAVATPIEINQYGQIQNWPTDFFGDVSGEATAIGKAGLEKRRLELEANAGDD